MEILVALAYVIVFLTIAVVVIGCLLLFIFSINGHFGQGKPKAGSATDLAASHGKAS
ncbi:hypothetical protein [Rhodococcus kronopolitis]|uniref:Adenylate cyclase n=1 Tax=Rhodococcus kronopolitis TaxID=1460226 RepID=A0ABV9FXG4_9NOCA